MLNKIKAFDKAHVAVSFAALKTSESIASFQADHYMTPASNIKLLTFLAAVESFDSLPSLYYHEKDSVTHFKSTGYPLLLHPYSFGSDARLGFLPFPRDSLSWIFH